jgi:hypothetical protein
MPKAIRSLNDTQRLVQNILEQHTSKNAIKLRDLTPQPEADPFLHQALTDAQNTNYEGMGQGIEGRGFVERFRDVQRGHSNPVIRRLLENDDMVDKVEGALLQEGITSLDTPQPVRSETYGRADDPDFQTDPHAPVQGYDSAVMFSPENVAVKFSNERKTASTEVPQFARFSRASDGSVMPLQEGTIPLFGAAEERRMLVKPDVDRNRGIRVPPKRVALSVQPELSYTHPVYPDLRNLEDPVVRRIRQVLDQVLNRQGYDVDDLIDNSGNIMYASQDPNTLYPVAIDGRFEKANPQKAFRMPTIDQFLGKAKYAVPAAVAAQQGESPLSGLTQ